MLQLFWHLAPSHHQYIRVIMLLVQSTMSIWWQEANYVVKKLHFCNFLTPNEPDFGGWQILRLTFQLSIVFASTNRKDKD
jgi:hypothetical protein